MMEFIPRKMDFDPIKKVFWLLDDGCLYGLVCRQSGGLDIYYNMVRINSPPLSEVVVEDFEGDFQKVFLKVKGDDQIEEISTGLREKMHYSNSKKTDDIRFFSQSKQHRIKYYGMAAF